MRDSLELFDLIAYNKENNVNNIRGENMGIENLALSSDVIELLEDLGGTKAADKNIKVAIATALFASKSVSLARAAEVAELEIAEFINILRHKNMAWNEYTEDELTLDMAFISDLDEKYEND